MGITIDHGKTFTQIALPIGQMYHVAVGRSGALLDLQQPAGRWDDARAERSPVAVPNVPSVRWGDGRQLRTGGGCRPRRPRRPRRRREAAAARAASARRPGSRTRRLRVGLHAARHHRIPTSSGRPATATKSRAGTRARMLARSVSPWMHTLDSPPNLSKYRCHWTPPLAIDPFDHNTVYYGCQVIFTTSNGGQSWTVISPDLSTKIRARSCRLAASSATTSVSSTAKWSSRSRRPRAEGADLGRHQRRPGLVHARRAARTGPTSRRTSAGTAAVGHGTADRAVELRRRHGLRRRRPAPRGQPRAVHLQDDGFRRDVEEDQRRPPVNASARLTRSQWPRIRIAAACCSRAPATASTTRWTTADTGRSSRTGLPAAPVTWIVVPKLWHDVVISTYGRGLFILRRHHAAGAERQGADRCVRVRVRSAARVS